MIFEHFFFSPPAYIQSQSHNSTFINDDTISISSTLPTPSTSSTAPEIPRRLSTTIISNPSHNSSFNTSDHINKPLLSPRHPLPTVSPKIIDSLTEDLRNLESHQSPDPISPSTFMKPRGSFNHHHKLSNDHERSSPVFNSSSPHNIIMDMNESNGQSLPISPHVNVHPGAQNFTHKAPPLPPRKKNPIEITHSQMQQAKDAPPLQPRDPPPPPLPPRTHSGSNNCHKHESWSLVILV